MSCISEVLGVNFHSPQFPSLSSEWISLHAFKTAILATFSDSYCERQRVKIVETDSKIVLGTLKPSVFTLPQFPPLESVSDSLVLPSTAGLFVKDLWSEAPQTTLSWSTALLTSSHTHVAVSPILDALHHRVKGPCLHNYWAEWPFP